MNNIINIENNGLFKTTISRAIPLAFDESMSYYEMLCALIQFIKETVVPAINNDTVAIGNLNTRIDELQSYVDHYFDNLDIQTEINNKLDEMAESGELTEIIAQYLQLAGVLAYDTIEAMNEAENIVNGSICYTLGQLTYNDGKGAFYKIRTVTSGDVVDGFNIVALDISDTLIAERLPNYYLNQTNTRIDNIVAPQHYLHKKYLLIGDSYATGYQGSGVPTIEGYFTKVVNDLNLNAQIVAENGYGFMGMGGTHKWKTLLENTTINNKSSFTDVIISGGMNDRGIDDDFETVMSELFTYLETNFPNAEIHVACVGRYAKNSTDTNLRDMRKVAKLYKTITINHGHKYIDGSELILHNMSWFISDDIHPNTTGEIQLAYGFKQYIVNGSIESFVSIANSNYFQTDTMIAESGITLHTAAYSTINKSNVTFWYNDQIDFDNNTTLNNLTDITIGQLTNSYICGSYGNQGLDEYVTGYVYSINEVNGSHFVKVGFRMYNDSNNKIHLKGFTVLDNGNLLSLTINQIAFPYGPIKCTINSFMC